MKELRLLGVPVVKKSIPILYFGDLHRYLASPVRVMTAALNPSRNEFPGEEWNRRFPGASESSQKTQFTAFNEYFRHDPLWDWFKHLDWLLEGMKSGFRTQRSSCAIHTDLCTPIATDPTYSGLTNEQKRVLEELGLPLWYELATLLDPDVIVMCGGTSLRDRVTVFERAKWLGIFGKRKKAVHVAEVTCWGRRRLGVFGWTVNVPFGALASEERNVVGGLVAQEVKSRKICAVHS